MNRLFSYDSKLSNFIRKISELLMVNTYWLICCLPIITIGAASAAMYHTLNKCVLHDRGTVGKEFFGSFKKNLKQGLIFWLLYIIAGFIFVECVYYFYQRMLEGKAYGLLYLLYVMFLIGLLLMVVYTFGYIARFESKVQWILRDVFLIMLTHPLNNIKLFFLMAAAGIVIYLVPMFMLLIPVGIGLMVCMWLEPIFRKYMSHEDLEREALLNEKEV